MRTRREVLRFLGGSLALGTALAQGGHMHGGGSMAMGKDRVSPQPIPWETGTCAFCGMPIATPKDAYRGKTFQLGFFEQTYSQIAFKEPRKAPHSGETVQALHFESIACMVNYAWVHGLVDGEGMTFYVTDRGAYQMGKPETVQLIPARDAVYYWGEKLMVVMNAHLLAFSSARAAQAYGEAHKDKHGRQAFYRFQTLLDLAPLPEMNLVALLAQHAGLLKPSMDGMDGGEHQHHNH